MSKFICLNCCAVFDEDEIISRVIDRHPYGESYAPEYGCCCPECLSHEIEKAFKCDRCGEYYPIESRNWRDNEQLCDNCEEAAQDEEASPYCGCGDVFSVLDVMIGA